MFCRKQKSLVPTAIRIPDRSSNSSIRWSLTIRFRARNFADFSFLHTYCFGAEGSKKCRHHHSNACLRTWTRGFQPEQHRQMSVSGLGSRAGKGMSFHRHLERWRQWVHILHVATMLLPIPTPKTYNALQDSVLVEGRESYTWENLSHMTYGKWMWSSLNLGQ